MSGKIFYIWDRHPVLEKELKSDNQLLVSSSEQLEQLRFEPEPDRAYLLVELNWGHHSKSELYGLQVLTQLRVQLKWHCPVFLCSALSKEAIFRIPNGIVSILNTPGHHFIQLPAKVWKHEPQEGELLPLSNNLLADVNYHFFDLRGMVDEIFHNIKSKASSHAISSIEEGYDQLFSIFPKEVHDKIFLFRSRLFENLKNNQAIARIKHIANIKEEVLSLLSTSEQSKQEALSIDHWQVLCIDDNHDTLKRLKNELGARGIHTQLASNGPDAFEILKKDYYGELEKPTSSDSHFRKNSITVVVCDLRFIDKQGKWDYWQGWDIIDEIFYNHPNMVSFFVLTSKKGSIVQRARQNKKVRVAAFAKEDCLHFKSPEAFNLFADRILEEGEKTYESLISTPSGKYWTGRWDNKFDFPFRQFYRHHRLSENYQAVEDWISDCANKYIAEAELVMDRFFRNKKSISDLGFSYQFKSGQNKPPSDPGNMKKFYLKLIGRRIALGLHLKGWDVSDISDIMKYQELRDGTNDRQLFVSYLALSTRIGNEIPNHLLVEEKVWIEQEIGYSLNPTNRNLFQAIAYILEGFQDILRDADCDDPFVDEDTISIGNKEQLHQLIDKVIHLAKKYHRTHDLKNHLTKLKERPSLNTVSAKTLLSTFIQALS